MEATYIGMLFILTGHFIACNGIYNPKKSDTDRLKAIADESPFADQIKTVDDNDNIEESDFETFLNPNKTQQSIFGPKGFYRAGKMSGRSMSTNNKYRSGTNKTETGTPCDNTWKKGATVGVIGGSDIYGNPVYICGKNVGGSFYHGVFQNGTCTIWKDRLEFQTSTDYELLVQGSQENHQWKASETYPSTWHVVLGTRSGAPFHNTVIVKCQLPAGNWMVGHGPFGRDLAYYFEGNTVTRCSTYLYLTCEKNQGQTAQAPPNTTSPTKPTPPPLPMTFTETTLCFTNWKLDAQTGFDIGNQTDKVEICRYKINGTFFHGPFKDGVCRIWTSRLKFEVTKGYELLQKPEGSFEYHWESRAQFPTDIKLVMGTEKSARFRTTFIVRCLTEQEGVYKLGHGPENKPFAYYIKDTDTAPCEYGHEYLSCSGTPPPTVEPSVPDNTTVKPGVQKPCKVKWRMHAQTGVIGGETPGGSPIYICRHKLGQNYYHGGYSEGLCQLWIEKKYFVNITQGYELLVEGDSDKYYWVASVGVPQDQNVIVGSTATNESVETYVVVCKQDEGNWVVGHGPKNSDNAYIIKEKNTAPCSNATEYLVCDEQIKPTLPSLPTLINVTWEIDAKVGLVGGSTKEGEKMYICRYKVDGNLYHGPYFNNTCQIWEQRQTVKNITNGYELLVEKPGILFEWKPSPSFPKTWNLVVGTQEKKFIMTYIVRCIEEDNWFVGHGPFNRDLAYFVTGNGVMFCTRGYEYLVISTAITEPTGVPTLTTPFTQKPPVVPPPTKVNHCEVGWKKDATVGFPTGEKFEGGNIYICRHKLEGKYFHGSFKNGSCLLWEPRLQFNSTDKDYELLEDSKNLVWKQSSKFPSDWKLILGTEPSSLFLATYIVKCRTQANRWEVGHAPANKPFAYYMLERDTNLCSNGFAYLTCKSS